MNVTKIRKDFLILNRKINGKKIVYFDNAATSLKPKQVIMAENCYYEKNCSNINRGIHDLSEEATILFEESRQKIAKFVGAKKEEVIFTKNCTESINLLAYSLINNNFVKKGDKIILSEMEHHSNIVPWQFVAKKVGAKIVYINVKKNFDIDYDDLEKKCVGAKIVSITGASNTIACVPKIKKIEKIVHKNNALFCVDAAQLIMHKKIDFKKTNIDYLFFSGHKMLGPTGIGCLVGKQKLLEKMCPFIFGGDMVKSVSKQKTIFEDTPKKFEAGTPNIAGAIGLGKATEYLEKIGYKKILTQEKKLVTRCLKGLKKLNVKTFHCENGAPIILFDCGFGCHEIAILLNDEGIAIRSGMHCAEPIITKINENGLARISFAFYNTEKEVDYFLKRLEFILKQL